MIRGHCPPVEGITTRSLAPAEPDRAHSIVVQLLGRFAELISRAKDELVTPDEYGFLMLTGLGS